MKAMIRKKQNPTIIEFAEGIQNRRWRGPFHSDKTCRQIIDADGILVAKFETAAQAADFLEVVAEELQERIRVKRWKEKQI
jgi:hypothetical protein